MSKSKKMKNLIRFDWAMKRLLRDKSNFDVLEGFLTELLKFDLKIQHIGESESNQKNERDKFNRVDILAETSSKEIILIELQIDSQSDYFQRMLYGVSKAISDHIYLGETYDKLKKVYSINIVYFQLGQGEDYVYHGTTEFKGLHSNDILELNERQKSKFNIQDINHIFPEYYILKINDFNNVAKDGLDEWIYFLKNNEIKSDFKAKGLDIAKQKLSLDHMNDRERIAYDEHMENERYRASMIETIRYDAQIDGFEKGIEQGIEQGIERGIKQGITNTQLEIAKKLKLSGMNSNEIADITGLNVDDIERLS